MVRAMWSARRGQTDLMEARAATEDEFFPQERVVVDGDDGACQQKVLLDLGLEEMAPRYWLPARNYVN